MKSPPAILQLRIELLDIEPLIWRRVQVPADYSFWDLHVAIQSAFGWNDSHLHEFQVPGGRWPERRFGIPTESLAGEKSALPGWEHRIADFLSPQSPRLRYWYDFGDDWMHEVVLEERGHAAPGKRYPRCIDGARAGPPDDCGGAPGYAHLIQVLSDPQHPEFEEILDWMMGAKKLRGPFDPEAFDEQAIKFASPGPRLKRLLAWLAGEQGV